jgi:hypothetical protein
MKVELRGLLFPGAQGDAGIASQGQAFGLSLA